MHSDAAQELLLRLGGCGPGVEQEMRERDERNEMVRARFEYTVRRYIPSPEVYIFGSSYTGLTSSTSDVDMLLVVNRAFAASAAEKYAEYQKMLKAEAQLSRLRNSERVVLFLKGFIGSEFFRMSSDGKKVQRSKDSDVIGNDIDGSTMDDEGDVGVEGRDDEADISDDDDLEHKGLDDGSDEEECVVHPSVPPTNGRSAVNNVDDLLTIRSVMFSAIKDFIKKHRAILEASSENVDIVKQARAFIKQQDERERQDKVLYLRKAMGALRNDPNYLIKDFVSQARVPVANFSDANAVPSVDCDVIVNNLLGLYNSRMIREYVFFDASGKIRAFIMLIKKFASKNRINVASEQTLSSYAWVIMALHLLLRLGLLPNFQDDATLSAVPLEERTIVSGIDCTFVVPDPSSKAALSARRAIAATSVSQLLVKFFEYYTRVIDITQSCISLRNKGEVLRCAKSLDPYYIY
jgi:predicted nucleotidyltransferase